MESSGSQDGEPRFSSHSSTDKSPRQPFCDSSVRPIYESLRPTFSNEMKGDVDSALSTMVQYQLLREDMDSIFEISTWPGQPNWMANVDSKVKAALTRAMNKSTHLLPYATGTTVSKRKRGTGSIGFEEEAELDSETRLLFTTDGVDGDIDLEPDSMPQVGSDFYLNSLFVEDI
ncbi:unnamed protein product [Protopolystoma xenopodis]|uniref:DNA replication factor RFC1 C-terminal domain-containing protein n=1 Tax=Protopolystoma xenopodis TaxID=117903 RepID=A0A448WG27_9PLAT|nr:unnamed protein product [Protopolystoma xenopodis]